MSLKHEVAKTRFKLSGRFDYKAFYDHFYGVIASNGYIVLDESYEQKFKGPVQKVEVTWEFFKEVDDYTKFLINVEVIIKNFTEVIVKKGDKEVKVNEGDVYVLIHGRMETDWQNLWEKNSFLEKLRDFYERYFFKKTKDDYIVEVYKDVFLFENEVKSFFELPRFM